MSRYYEAYDNRYRQIHKKNLSWASENPSPIVGEILKKYGISREDSMLELGCGEGRDARFLLEQGYSLTATDISPEAVRYCRERDPAHERAYQVLDAVNGGQVPEKFGFIYAEAVLHMLVLDEDRDQFYGFVRDHLSETGVALLLSMGDGEDEMQSDISQAFQDAKRIHEGTGQEVEVASTSCRMVTLEHFKREIARNGLVLLEMGTTAIEPDFPVITYAVMKADA